MSLSQTPPARCAPGRRRRTRGRRGRTARRRRGDVETRGLARAEGGGDRAAGHAGAGRLGSGCRRPRATRAHTSTTIVAAIAQPGAAGSRTTPSTSRRPSRDFERWADEGFGVPDFLRLARGLPAAAAPGRRHPSSRRVPDVHAERVARTGYVEALIVEVIWPEFIAAARGASTSTSCSCRCGSSTSRPATTRTRPCCSPRRSRCARSRRSRGARSSRTARRRATAASCARHPRSPSSTCPTRRRGCWTTRRSPSRRS